MYNSPPQTKHFSTSLQWPISGSQNVLLVELAPSDYYSSFHHQVSALEVLKSLTHHNY